MHITLQAVPLPFSQGLKGYLTGLAYQEINWLLRDGRLYVPNQKDLPDYAQRSANTANINALALYLLNSLNDGQPIFFPSVALNLQCSFEYSPDRSVLQLPFDAALRCIDGQTRLYGIQTVYKWLQPQQFGNSTGLSDAAKTSLLQSLRQMELGAVLYDNLTLEQERQLFRDINLLAKRPSTTLMHSFDTRSLTTQLAKALAETVPAFQGQVEYNSSTVTPTSLVTLATLVTATQAMFPRLEKDGVKDLSGYQAWATAFWNAVANALTGQPWSVDSDARGTLQQESLVCAAILFQALGRLCHNLLADEQVPAEDLPLWLKPLGTIDWRRSNPEWVQLGIAQNGAKGVIISNTKTTVSALHRYLQTMTGVTTETGTEQTLSLFS